MRTFIDLDNCGAEDIPDCPDYKRWLFALALFHSIVLERRRFGALGWNRSYDWTVFDFRVGLCNVHEGNRVTVGKHAMSLICI